jgi:hypothetical protein
LNDLIRLAALELYLESDESLWVEGSAFKQAAVTPHNEVQPVAAM